MKPNTNGIIMRKDLIGGLAYLLVVCVTLVLSFIAIPIWHRHDDDYDDAEGIALNRNGLFPRKLVASSDNKDCPWVASELQLTKEKLRFALKRENDLLGRMNELEYLLQERRMVVDDGSKSRIFNKPEGGALKEYVTKWIARDSEKVVFVITPTYERITQKVDLIRMSQALMLAGNIYWIVVEDTEPSHLSIKVRKILYESNIPFAHLGVKTPPSETNFRGVLQRNKGIDVVKHFRARKGFVYFGDDDNAYDYRLFDDIRSIQTSVGVFATGFSGNGNYERCLIDPKTGVVTGFLSNFRANRTFMVDMGGFAFKTELFQSNPDWKIRTTNVKKGHLEDSILASLIAHPWLAEPIGNCTTVRFWHLSKCEKSIYSARVRRAPRTDPLYGSE